MGPPTVSGERSEGLRLGRIAGIPIFLNPSWFLVFTLVTWSLASGYFPRLNPQWPASVNWGLALVSSLLFFTSVLAHELSHSLVALGSGLPIASITLYVFGGVARITEEPGEAAVEARVAAAGPLASFGLAVLFILLSFFPVGEFAVAVFRYLGTVNLLLAVFNLLPGFPLDGGRLLRAFLWHRWKDLTRATRAAARSGHILAYLFMAVGAGTLVLGGFIGGLWWLMLGWFLDNAARSGYQHVLVREALEDVRVGDLMQSDVVVVDADLTVSDFIDQYLLRHQQRSFPVWDGESLAGLVTLDDVRKVSVGEREAALVRDIMTGRQRLCLARAEDSAYDALRCMVTHDVGRLPVMVDDRVVGLISRDHLLRVVALRSER